MKRLRLFVFVPAWLTVVGCPEPPVEICGNGLDDDDNGVSDCNDALCADRDDCQVIGECVVDLNFPERDARTAEPLDVQTEVSGTICPQFDDDGYLIAVPDPGTIILVSLAMDTNLTQIEPAYSILKDNGSETADPTGISARDPQLSAGEPVNFTGAHRLDEAGSYIVVVADVEGLGAFDNVNTYTLSVDLVPDPDANEPNNVVEQAAPLAAGTTNGIIATSGDEDWFAIAAPGAGQIMDLTISVPDQSGVEHIVTLFAPDGISELQTALLAPSETTPGTLEARLRKSTTTAVPGAAFLLRIRDTGDDGDQDSQLDLALGQYTIELAIVDDPDPNEDGTANEDFVTAVQVPSAGGSFTGALAAIADNDFFRIAAPAGTSAAAPRVLIVTTSFSDATFNDDFEPQVRVLGTNPEVTPATCDPDDPADPQDPVTNCPAGTPLCMADNTCGAPRLQRFINRAPFVTAYPLRDTRPVYITINEFGDDGFQAAGTYDIDIEIVVDPDPVADDFLVPNLEEAGYQNGPELDQQRGASLDRATVVNTGFLPPCDDVVRTGVGCIDRRAVTNLVAFNPPVPDEADCSDPEVSTVTRTLTGQLTYEGDRDYFFLDGIPSLPYWGVQLDYSLSAATPIEIALFVYAGGGLGASTLRADETGSCDEFDCGANGCGPDNCDPGSICVDRRCWTDALSNTGGNFEFGPQSPNNECVVAGPFQDPPIFVEVVDNGINDFDHAMEYSIDVTITCGCPAACDNDQDYCQNGL